MRRKQPGHSKQALEILAGAQGGGSGPQELLSLSRPTASSAAAAGTEAAANRAAELRYLREYWRPSVLASQRVYGLSLLS